MPGDATDEVGRQALVVAAQPREQAAGGVESGLDSIHVLDRAEDGEARGRRPEVRRLHLPERLLLARAPALVLDLRRDLVELLLQQAQLFGRAARVERDRFESHRARADRRLFFDERGRSFVFMSPRARLLRRVALVDVEVVDRRRLDPDEQLPVARVRVGNLFELQYLRPSALMDDDRAHLR